MTSALCVPYSVNLTEKEVFLMIKNLETKLTTNKENLRRIQEKISHLQDQERALKLKIMNQQVQLQNMRASQKKLEIEKVSNETSKSSSKLVRKLTSF